MGWQFPQGGCCRKLNDLYMLFTAISDHFFCYCCVLTNNLNQSAQITSWVIHMKKDHPLRHVKDGVKLVQKYKIHYFPIPIIHLVYPHPTPTPQKVFA